MADKSIRLGTDGTIEEFELSKNSVDLGNVDNTSDADKPVSTATQTALNLKYDASNPNNYINASTSNTFTADQVMSETLIINKDVVFDGPVNAGNSGTSINIDWNSGNRQVMTMTDNCTVTFTDPLGACNLLIKLIQDATGSRTITFPAAVKFPAGVEPVLTTTANAEDIVSFYFDGTTYYGIPSYNFQ